MKANEISPGNKAKQGIRAAIGTGVRVCEVSWRWGRLRLRWLHLFGVQRCVCTFGSQAGWAPKSSEERGADSALPFAPAPLGSLMGKQRRDPGFGRSDP